MQRTTRGNFFIAAVLFFSALAACQTTAMAQSTAANAAKTEVWWLGQSAMRITTPGGKVIMVDPWITTNPKTPEAYKNLDALGKLDIILVTHAHGDHLGDGVALARKNNAPLWGPAGLDQQVQTLGLLSPELAPRMNKGGSITPFPGVKITQVHAEHSSEMLWTDPDTKKQSTLAAGEPVGLIIELENGFTIYHMGDSALFGDMKFIGEHYHPDLVMIPIGGHFVMNPQDAAFATAQFLHPKYAIPMHYGTTPQLKGTPKEYMDALGSAPVKVFPINPGDKLSF
jgi:L-ascorbate metabolism protein UlaG (beta-lactamase superfamily)